MDEFTIKIGLERLKQLVAEPVGLPVAQLLELSSVVISSNETNAVKQKFMNALLNSLIKNPQASSDTNKIVKLCRALANYNQVYIN
jgi:hypothetical protein